MYFEVFVCCFLLFFGYGCGGGFGESVYGVEDGSVDVEIDNSVEEDFFVFILGRFGVGVLRIESDLVG